MEGKIEIKKLIDDFYSIISGKAEEERDWDSFRKLFYVNAHLTSTRFDNNECIALPKDVESYIIGLDKFLKSNEFYEYGFNYEISIIGKIAQVYSEYEAKRCLDDNEPTKKGINLVQLINDGYRWKIVSMLWEDN